MINIIGSVIVGLTIGLIALFIYPEAATMGSATTLALGVGGALLTSIGFSLRGGFQRAGCLASVLGAVALIVVGRLIGWRQR